MARKKVPATYGSYTAVIGFPGDQDWAEHVHRAFDQWTLKMAQDGPSEAVAVLPAFEVVEETEDEPAMFKLTFVGIIAASGWAAVEECIDTLQTLAPDLLEEGTALRLGVGAERVVGREVEVDAPEDS